MDGVIKERKDDYELNITKTLESNLYMYLKMVQGCRIFCKPNLNYPFGIYIYR